MERRQNPLVSIVTPSYNMARFLEETIQSVLNQDYPHIEYIIMDGGSDDGTLEILRKYENRLRYVSRPDKGQTDAINQGFLQSNGEIFAFLNADDTYLPGAVTTAVRAMLSNPSSAGVYGEGYLVDVSGRTLQRYPTRAFDAELLRTRCFICQPTVFLWRDAFVEAGLMDLDQHYALDYDLWIRIARYHPLLKVDEYLANSRMHRGAKTLAHRRAVYRSAIRVVKRHYGYVSYGHIYGYSCSLLDKRDGFFEPVPPSFAKYALSLAYGSFQNIRHLRRFWTEAIQAGTQALDRGAWPPRTGDY